MSTPLKIEQWVRVPRQRRSRETMHRILDAAEALIAERPWDEVTVREIVDRSRASVGAFYARFPDKEALLHGLDERFYVELEALLERLLEPGRWAEASLEEIVAGMYGLVVRIFRERPAFHRLLVLIPRLRPNPRFEQLGHRYRTLIERMGGVLLERREEISSPDPERAVRTALVTGVLMIREAVVFPDGPAGALGATDEELVAEFTRMTVRYLGAGGAA